MGYVHEELIEGDGSKRAKYIISLLGNASLKAEEIIPERMETLEGFKLEGVEYILDGRTLSLSGENLLERYCLIAGVQALTGTPISSVEFTFTK